MTRPPRFVYAVVVVVLLGLVAAGAASWGVYELRAAEERRDCARALASRQDARAMWLYLIDTASPEAADQKRYDDFVAELDKRLPALECRDGDPVPVDDERSG